VLSVHAVRHCRDRRLPPDGQTIAAPQAHRYVARRLLAAARLRQCHLARLGAQVQVHRQRRLPNSALLIKRWYRSSQPLSTTAAIEVSMQSLTCAEPLK
jgi:hypothetical protein